MATGNSQRFGARDPLWFREPNFQEEAGINPLRSWIDSLLVGPTTRDNGQMRNRAGNTAPLQSFEQHAGLGASVNHRDDIARSAAQHTNKPWGAL